MSPSTVHSSGVGRAEQPVPLVDHGDKLEIIGRVDGPAHLGAHPPACAQHAHPDRFVVLIHGSQLSGTAGAEPGRLQRARQPAQMVKS